MTLKGLGSFLQANVLSASAQRFIAGRNAKLKITAPTAAELGVPASSVNQSVKVHIRVNTSRHSSPYATDFIKRGRPFVFEILVTAAWTSANVATKLAQAFTQYESQFNLAEDGLPFTWVDDLSGGLTLTLKDPYLSFGDNVVFTLAGETYGVTATSTSFIDSGLNVDGIQTTSTTLVLDSTDGLRVGDKFTLPSAPTTVLKIKSVDSATNLTLESAFTVSTVNLEALTLDYQAQEPTYDGKYLEENVRMSTEATSGSYGISPDEKPVISGSYTQIQFTCKVTGTSGIDGNWAPHKNMGIYASANTGDGTVKFTLYCLEGSDLFASGGTVEDIVTFLVGGTPTIATFLLANGTAASSAATFIA